MKVAIGADGAGFALKEILKTALREDGHTVIDCGADSSVRSHYPLFAKAVCDKILAGEAERGILVCGTGIGMSIAANKIRGIRAATVSEHYSARYARSHNDVQVLCLGARVIGAGLAQELVSVFLNTEALGGRHMERIQMIEQFEQND